MPKPVPVLDRVVCPGCARRLPRNNYGCPSCGWQDNAPDEAGKHSPKGRIRPLRFYLSDRVASLNDVCALFLRLVYEAGATNAGIETSEASRLVIASSKIPEAYPDATD